MKYVPLHLHTEYSLLDGAIRIKDLFEYAKNNNIKLIDGVYTNNLPVSGLNSLIQSHYNVISYDVEINGILYKDCPLIQTSNIFSTDSSCYFIGNPYLINTTFGLDRINTLYKSKVCHLEDNGFPFLLIVKDLNSAKFLDDFIYGTPEWISSLVEDTINIKIGEAAISTVTHMLPSHLLPAELRFTNWVFDKQKNSISAKSAYAATGVNAFAIGSGTKATNANSMAIGASTQATGLRSFAGGQNSVAANQNAFAFGNSVTANANNSTAFGLNTFSGGENQFIIGKYNILDSTKAFIIGNGASDVQRNNALTVDWNGNLQVSNSIESQFIILSSPSGKKFQITVDDDGILITKEIIN